MRKIPAQAVGRNAFKNVYQKCGRVLGRRRNEQVNMVSPDFHAFDRYPGFPRHLVENNPKSRCNLTVEKQSFMFWFPYQVVVDVVGSQFGSPALSSNVAWKWFWTGCRRKAPHRSRPRGSVLARPAPWSRIRSVFRRRSRTPVFHKTDSDG